MSPQRLAARLPRAVCNLKERHASGRVASPSKARRGAVLDDATSPWRLYVAVGAVALSVLILGALALLYLSVLKGSSSSPWSAGGSTGYLSSGHVSARVASITGATGSRKAAQGGGLLSSWGHGFTARLLHATPHSEELQKLYAALPPVTHTLRFEVCNGFANQRLAVVYGILLAQRLNRTAVIPRLLADGLQRSNEAVTLSAAAAADGSVAPPAWVPFSSVYDEAHFRLQLARAGVRVVHESEAPPDAAYIHAGIQDVLTALGGSYHDGLAAALHKGTNGAALHLALDCPLFKLQPGELSHLADGPIIWGVLDAMRPVAEAAKLVDQAIAGIGKVAIAAAQQQAGAAAPWAMARRSRSLVRAAAEPPRYNFLHLRMENDWVEHCKRWSAIADGLVRDNCYNNTEEIDVSLKLFGFNPAVPLYVASFWDDVDHTRLEKVMARLLAAGYRVVTAPDVLQWQQLPPSRELRALIEYHIGMRAHRFIGNSVSTFAALALLERRHHGKWAAYYNGGNLPLASYLPVHQLPWVVTYNSWSSGYDYMLKAALRSAQRYGTLKPYCIFDGDTNSPIYRWLADSGVTLIRHVPAWRDQLVERAGVKMKDNVQHSHLFKSPDMLVSTFQRVDLPVVPILDQYTYVLYTDADVFFRKPIHLDDFGLPLPKSVSMSYEFYNMFPYNAGVILANLPNMRRRYQAFIEMMLANEDGMYWPDYGPGDQGIINKFYEHDLRGALMSQAFNTKPYNAFEPGSFVVHFHGPKPHEYMRFLTNGTCDFYQVCEQAFLKALCSYVAEWVTYLPDEVEALRLADACSWLGNPNVVAVFEKKHGLAPQAQAVPDDGKESFVHADHGRSDTKSSDAAASATAAAAAAVTAQQAATSK